MIFKQIKRCSVSFIIREIHNETILRYQFVPIIPLTLYFIGEIRRRWAFSYIAGSSAK